MASKTDIANLALSKLGDEDTLVELNADTRQGRSISAVFDAMRDAVLRAHPWNWAIGRAALPALVTAPLYGPARAFALPADFIRFVDQDAFRDYQVEGGNILSDAPAPLNIRYVRRIVDTGLYDPLFVEALAGRIASQVAMRLTGNAQVKQAAWNEYQAAIAEARRVDGVENPPEDWPEDDWLIAREADY